MPTHRTVRALLPRLRSFALVALAAAALSPPSRAQDHGGHKPTFPKALPKGPVAASQDFGEIAVIVENGLTSTGRNPFDLDGRTVRFDPAGNGSYVVSTGAGAIEPDLGPALTFGLPGAMLFPGDDVSQE